MKNLYKWLLMAIFAFTVTVSFNACNKVKVADKGEQTHGDDEHSTCGKDCKKACCNKEQGSSANSDSSRTMSAHTCDSICKTNGCSHSH